MGAQTSDVHNELPHVEIAQNENKEGFHVVLEHEKEKIALDKCQGEPWPFLSGLQRAPEQTELQVFEELKKDLETRNQIGFRIHAKPLFATDDRDWLKEAYEEALDLCVYLKAQLMRRGK